MVRAQEHEQAAHGDAVHGDAAEEGAEVAKDDYVYVYDPANPTDPFDTLAQAVSSWMADTRGSGIIRKDDNWQRAFCSCMETGDIASWYQQAPALYIVDQCAKDKGLILRTGHMQDRYQEPMQAAISCDMLKLMSYCFSHTCDECLPKWTNYCDAAHYSSPGCDVVCSGAVRTAGGSVLVLLFAAAAVYLGA